MCAKLLRLKTRLVDEKFVILVNFLAKPGLGL